MDFDTAWLEEVRKVARDARAHEGIVVSVETRTGRQDKPQSDHGLASVPGGSISTRLPNGEPGPTLTIWVGLSEARKTAERISRNFPRES